MKFLFKNLLLANYSFAKRWVNKKMPERIIPSTLHIFSTPFSFIAAGIYFMIIGSLNFRFKSYLPILIGLGVIMLGLTTIIERKVKTAIIDWNIEEEYKTLTESQRRSKNFFAFIFFWVGFIIFFYLAVIYFEGYLTK